MESIPQGKSAGRMFGTNCPSQDVWQGELVRIAKLSEGDLVAVGTASLNLFCGAVLPAPEGLDRIKLYAILAAWEDYIQRNTEHWWSDFLKNPHDGVETPGKFRMAAMATLLQRQLGIRYNLSFTEGDYDGRDSRNLFLHGPLSGFGGTVSRSPCCIFPSDAASDTRSGSSRPRSISSSAGRSRAGSDSTSNVPAAAFCPGAMRSTAPGERRSLLRKCKAVRFCET